MILPSYVGIMINHYKNQHNGKHPSFFWGSDVPNELREPQKSVDSILWGCVFSGFPRYPFETFMHHIDTDRPGFPGFLLKGSYLVDSQNIKVAKLPRYQA